jgi:DNA mismatch endonuclease, patch repair protein
MTDILTKKQHSETMSKVHSRDTKPEWILRCGLHRLGFRYRLNNCQLPGRPDLVFPKFHAVVFVHGCFWHRHPGCKNAGMPKSNVDFWESKFAENVERDQRKKQELEKGGWRIMVVWECELSRYTVESIQRVAHWLKRETSYGDYAMNRSELLAVAEGKVRYRIAANREKSGLNAFRLAEVRRP